MICDMKASQFNIFKRMKARGKVAPLAETSEELARFYSSPLGKAILASQKEVLDEELSCLFGYHLMQLSITENIPLHTSSRINHCFSLAPLKDKDTTAGAVADYDSLPFEDESIDVTLLHHVLEFSENPQQVLKEAARVTVPRGYIVLMGFNPTSIAGLAKTIVQYFSSKKIWKRHGLRVGRLKDWLDFLDFSTVSNEYSFFNLPINNEKYIHRLGFFRRWRIFKSFPFGSIYFLIARKDKVAFTPIKPAWESSAAAVKIAVHQKRAIKSGSAVASAMVLPLRKRHH